jgi:Polyketide cyclase / dehydrase and lipid transport
MSTRTPLAVTVSTVIAANPETLYDLVTDVTNMGHLSPETTSATWIGDATVAAPGVRFKGSNAIGKVTWSTKPTITAADHGRRFAFQVPGRSGAHWEYRFDAVDGGTRVTESMSQERRSPAPIRFLQRRAGVTDRAAHLRQGMTTTLERLALMATQHPGVTSSTFR